MAHRFSGPPIKRLRQATLSFTGDSKEGHTVSTERSCTVFTSRLDAAGLEVHKVARDGNCMFPSISHQLQLCGIDKSAAQVRQVIVDLTAGNPVLPDGSTCESLIETSAGGLGSYVRNMSKDGTWGDGITLLVSSIVFGRKIVLFTDDKAQSKHPMNVTHDPSEDSSNTMFIGFVDGNHYVSLVKKSSSSIAHGSEEEKKSEVSPVRIDTEKKEERCELLDKFAVQTDIGWAVKKIVLSTEDRVLFMKPWKPQEQKDFPFSEHNVKNGKQRKRKLMECHLEKFPWLSVSRVPGLEGALCTPCVLFCRGEGVGGRSDGRGQKVGVLVTKQLCRFDDLTGKEGILSAHENKLYHAQSVIAMEEFRKRTTSGEGQDDIRSRMDKARQNQVNKNREALLPIIDTLLTCARQNIALRGHRGENDGIRGCSEPTVNDGNFRSLLRYRMRGGDVALLNHVTGAAANATYLSPTIQNELLVVAADLVRQEIQKQIRQAGCWALIADETMDLQKREQLVIVIRYLSADEDGVPRQREDPVAMLDLVRDVAHDCEPHNEKRLSGVAIAAAILRQLSKLDLDLPQCVAQCYDGASAMASQRVGVAAQILKQAELADYFHCMAHWMNLSTSQAVKVNAIRSAQTVVHEAAALFRTSSKKTAVLKQCIEDADDTRVSKRQLMNLCETRFLERHTAIVTFRQLFGFVAEALEEIKSWSSAPAVQSANSLYASMHQFEFVVGLVILENLAGLLLPVSRKLQAVENDLTQSIEDVAEVLSALENLRSETGFQKIFAEASLLAENHGIAVIRPRLSKGRSVYRPASGVEGDSAETYYRINAFYPAVDAIKLDVKLRFGRPQQLTFFLSHLLPRRFNNDETEEQCKQVQQAAEKYSSLLYDPLSVVNAEYLLWRRQWTATAVEQRPDSATATLNSCNSVKFPNVYRLLAILGTLPVTTCESERVFSELQKTLTSIRSTMREDRLEALLLLQCHREHCPTPDDVLCAFASTKARRLNFLL